MPATLGPLSPGPFPPAQVGTPWRPRRYRTPARSLRERPRRAIHLRLVSGGTGRSSRSSLRSDFAGDSPRPSDSLLLYQCSHNSARGTKCLMCLEFRTRPGSQLVAAFAQKAGPSSLNASSARVPLRACGRRRDSPIPETVTRPHRRAIRPYQLPHGLPRRVQQWHTREDAQRSEVALLNALRQAVALLECGGG